MTTEQNKQMARNVFESFNRNDLDAMTRDFDRNYVHRAPATGETRGADGFKEVITMYKRAFPDLHIEVETMMAEGDMVMVFSRNTGTHKGEFMGIAPTGKKSTVEFMARFTCKNGKIVEEVDIFDSLDILKQLDALPAELTG